MERTNAVLRLVFGINVFFLVMLAFSAPHLERGTGSFVAALVTAGLCVVMLSLVGAISYFEWDVFDRL